MEYSSFGYYLAKNDYLPFIFFFTILIMVRIGWYLGKNINERRTECKAFTDETLVSVILGLLGLILAFTFSSAATKLDHREKLILNEANSISSAIDSFDFFKKSDREKLRCLTNVYLNERIILYHEFSDINEFHARQEKVQKLLGSIHVLTLSSIRNLQATEQLLGIESMKRVTEMLDAYDDQRQAILLHPPRIIWITLVSLALIGSFLAGYKMGLAKQKEHLVSFIYATLMSGAFFLIISLEFPLLHDVKEEPFTEEFISLKQAV
ncbi:MAG: hypothetical protein ACOYBR_07715 [Fluviibacter sp.]